MEAAEKRKLTKAIKEQTEYIADLVEAQRDQCQGPAQLVFWHLREKCTAETIRQERQELRVLQWKRDQMDK